MTEIGFVVTSRKELETQRLNELKEKLYQLASLIEGAIQKLDLSQKGELDGTEEIPWSDVFNATQIPYSSWMPLYTQILNEKLNPLGWSLYKTGMLDDSILCVSPLKKPDET